MFYPKVSIIVPIYNLEDYIDRTVKSLQDQTYQNLEIILVDDGSSDNSLTIIKRLADIDSRIKCTTQPNGGAAKARNTGLALATGQYITFVDGDDMLSPNAIADNINYFIDDEIDWVALSVRKVNVQGDFLAEGDLGFIINKTEEIDSSKFVPYFYEHKLSGVVCGTIYRGSSIQNIHFKDGIFYEDSLFFIELLCNTMKAVLSTKGLYYYLDRPYSSNKALFTYKHIESKYYIETYTLSRLRELFPGFENYYTRSELLCYYFFKREAAKGTKGADYFYKSFKKGMKSVLRVNIFEEIKCLAYKCRIDKLLKRR